MRQSRRLGWFGGWRDLIEGDNAALARAPFQCRGGRVLNTHVFGWWILPFMFSLTAIPVSQSALIGDDSSVRFAAIPASLPGRPLRYCLLPIGGGHRLGSAKSGPGI
jgi:hypothetical protein